MMSRVHQFWVEHAAWSQATFGWDWERGPIGALKHLSKEALEAAENVGDLEEYADCLLLLFDATRRAGFSLDELLTAAFLKLDKNKKRQWQKPTAGDQPIEHVEGIHD
jgi:hypothetical protein